MNWSHCWHQAFREALLVKSNSINTFTATMKASIVDLLEVAGIISASLLLMNYSSIFPAVPSIHSSQYTGGSGSPLAFADQRVSPLMEHHFMYFCRDTSQFPALLFFMRAVLDAFRVVGINLYGMCREKSPCNAVHLFGIKWTRFPLSPDFSGKQFKTLRRLAFVCRATESPFSWSALSSRACLLSDIGSL